MTEAKYTPGPWWVDDFGNGDVFVGADPVKGMPPPFVDGRTFISKMYQKDERGIDAKANARLIAAAPDMLQRLEMCKRFLEDMHTQSPEVTVAVSQTLHETVSEIITKATGK